MNEPKPQQEPSMEEILASIRRIISEDGAGAAAEAKPPEPAPELQKADVLELTEVVEEQPAAAAKAEPEPAEAAGAEPEIELRDETPPEPTPLRVVPAAPAPPPTPAASGDDHGLIGQAAAAAATSALTSLVQAVDASRGGTPIGQGTRTIEDLVKEVMRPMIKDWLDANLPRLVERLVRKEIERLSHGAEGE